jgi:sugar lactone lactonase YvrE
VTCRDTLYRFEDDLYTGVGRDAANNDALACNPNNGDIYYIYLTDRRLYRVPFDGTTAQPGEVAVNVALPQDVSDGAAGMVVDGEDGSVYILVESTNTKSIVRVDAAGDQTTVYDFFDRGAGDAAGIQSDLAMDRGPIRYLYTLDTKNNKFLRYSIAFDQLVEITSSGNEFWASNASEGERVGLEVIPGAGP